MKDREAADRGRRAVALASLSGLALLSGLGVRAAAPASTPTSTRAPATERAALALRKPTQCVLLAAARAGQRLVAAGERGVVVWSDDGGRSWTQAEVPVSVSLTSLAFADDKVGFACGHMGLVLRTEDGGRKWQRVLEGRQAGELVLNAARAAWQAKPAGGTDVTLKLEDAQRLAAEGADKPLLHIALRADGSLVAVGAYGLALASRDGGKTWASLMHELPNPETFGLYGSVERGSEQWLFGEQGLLLRGEKGVFRAQAATSPATLFGGLALKDGTLLIAGLRGKVLRSAAPGAAFEMVSTPVDASLFGGLQLADGTVLLAGAAGQLLVSRDNGQRFVPAALPTRFPFAALAAAPDGALLLVGQRGLPRVEASALSRSPTA
jgi:photosystem II stability/assembly factor-like uncharacterized protein